MSELRLSGDEKFISSAEITERTADLAQFYDFLYGDDEVIVISVLHGAVRFAQNLTGAMQNQNIIEDSVRVSSMRGTEHVEPTLLKDTDVHIKGLNVLVVEDIDDTRSTLNFLLPRLRDREPRRLDLVSLLNKPTAEKVVDELNADSIKYGFSIVDEFVVGHGLDWKQLLTGKQYWRSLNHITLAVNVGGEAEEDQFWVPEVMTEDQEQQYRTSLRLIR